MSVFTVKLQQGQQGRLDKNPVTGLPFETSVQRTIFVAGPNRTIRILKDGDTFTDCNYWKKFAYPQVPLDQAFIVVTSDDGSVYSEFAEENVYPKVYNIEADFGSSFADNVADIAGDTSSYAVYVQITNPSSGDIQVRLNGSATFTLEGSSTQIFNNGDMAISKIEIDNTESGNSNKTIQIVTSIRSICNS